MEVNFSKVGVSKNKKTQDLMFQNQVVLIYEIDNFRVSSPIKMVEFLINKDLSYQEKAFLNNVQKTLYPQAVKDYLNSIKNDFPFNPYGAYLTYEITLNESCYFSYYYDNYVFTGGAHGTTLRKAKTYSLKTGRALPLQYFFKSGLNVKRQVLDIILPMAEENYKNNPGIYFDDYKSLMIKTFNPESFYLTPEGLVVYYGQYDIAPYVTGIVEFLIPYSVIDFKLGC